MVRPAWEGVVVDGSVPAFKPSLEAGASRFEQLELDRPARLLLHDRRSRPHPAAADQFADPDFHDVTTTQFAVDRKVEERPVANTPPSTTRPCSRSIRRDDLDQI